MTNLLINLKVGGGQFKPLRQRFFGLYISRNDGSNAHHEHNFGSHGTSDDHKE